MLSRRGDCGIGAGSGIVRRSCDIPCRCVSNRHV